MAILIFAPDYKPLPGGIATLSYEIAGALSRKDRVVVLAPAMKGARGFDADKAFRTIRVPNFFGTALFIYPFVLPLILSRYGIKWILCTVWFPSSVISMFWSRILKVPYLVMAHGSDFLDDKTTLRRRIKTYLSSFKIRAFKRAVKVITPSAFSGSRLAAMGVPPEKIALLRDGANPARFSPDVNSDEVKRRYGLHGKKVLLTIARLERHKGHDMVINALPEILKEFPELRYLIVGKGPRERALRQIVRERSLSEYVIFAGKVGEDELPQYYNACDVFIMPSRQVPGRNDLLEGFGISFIEAGACGKPAIGGRSGGIPDAVIDGETGILVDPVGIEGIRAAVSALLRDAELARRLGENARRRVLEELNWQEIADRIAGLIE